MEQLLNPQSVEVLPQTEKKGNVIGLVLILLVSFLQAGIIALTVGEPFFGSYWIVRIWIPTVLAMLPELFVISLLLQIFLNSWPTLDSHRKRKTTIVSLIVLLPTITILGPYLGMIYSSIFQFLAFGVHGIFFLVFRQLLPIHILTLVFLVYYYRETTMKLLWVNRRFLLLLLLIVTLFSATSCNVALISLKYAT